jgi:DNA-binding transcriptional LysR family regulator
MPAIVARMLEVAPNIKLRLTPFANDLVETGVVSGTTSMALGRFVDPPDNLVVEHLADDGLACVVRKAHPEVDKKLTRAQFERLGHVNVLPPGRMRTGLSQTLAQHQLKREVAISVTNFFAVAEMLAVTDHIAILPKLVCRRLARDPRLKVVPTPMDLGTFPVQIAWHVRYRHDSAHRWLRALVGETISQVAKAADAPAGGVDAR